MVIDASYLIIVLVAFLSLIIFYLLTTFHSIIWTVINIGSNIFLFHMEYEYVDSKTDLHGFSSLLFFTSFLVINKVFIDKFLSIFNPKRKAKNKLDALIYKARTANTAP
jgi:hypothetical protein